MTSSKKRTTKKAHAPRARRNVAVAIHELLHSSDFVPGECQIICGWEDGVYVCRHYCPEANIDERFTVT
jgi:hypothetical protein